jgi:DNA-directed RNA polymerase subunit RPC12/RpoP
VMLLQYLQFRAYTQMCPRCSQPLTHTRWGVYRTVPPTCPTCGLRIVES